MSFLSAAIILRRSDLERDFHEAFRTGSKEGREGFKRSASEDQFVGSVGLDDDMVESEGGTGRGA